MKNKLYNFMAKLMFPVRNEEGQGMVEYGLIIALVAIVVIGALIAVGGSITGIFGKASNVISSTAAAN